MQSGNTLDNFQDKEGAQVVYIPKHLQPSTPFIVQGIFSNEIPEDGELGEVAGTSDDYVYVQFYTNDSIPKINKRACSSSDLWFLIQIDGN